MRIVHYVNQFFGGKGGEEAADLEPDLQDGAVGPGRLLEQVLGGDAHVVRSIIVGDNYAAENLAALTERVVSTDSVPHRSNAIALAPMVANAIGPAGTDSRAGVNELPPIARSVRVLTTKLVRSEVSGMSRLSW